MLLQPDGTLLVSRHNGEHRLPRHPSRCWLKPPPAVCLWQALSKESGTATKRKLPSCSVPLFLLPCSLAEEVISIGYMATLGLAIVEPLKSAPAPKLNSPTRTRVMGARPMMARMPSTTVARPMIMWPPAPTA